MLNEETGLAKAPVSPFNSRVGAQFDDGRSLCYVSNNVRCLLCPIKRSESKWPQVVLLAISGSQLRGRVGAVLVWKLREKPSTATSMARTGSSYRNLWKSNQVRTSIDPRLPRLSHCAEFTELRCLLRSLTGLRATSHLFRP